MKKKKSPAYELPAQIVAKKFLTVTVPQKALPIVGLDIQIYLYLLDCRRNFHPTIMMMAEKLKMAEKSIRNGLDRLIAKGVIVKKPSGPRKGLKSPTNIYLFKKPWVADDKGTYDRESLLQGEDFSVVPIEVITSSLSHKGMRLLTSLLGFWNAGFKFTWKDIKERSGCDTRGLNAGALELIAMNILENDYRNDFRGKPINSWNFEGLDSSEKEVDLFSPDQNSHKGNFLFSADHSLIGSLSIGEWTLSTEVFSSGIYKYECFGKGFVVVDVSGKILRSGGFDEKSTDLLSFSASELKMHKNNQEYHWHKALEEGSRAEPDSYIEASKYRKSLDFFKKKEVETETTALPDAFSDMILM